MYLLRLFHINPMCLATDAPKYSGIQKKKNALKRVDEGELINGYYCTDF